MLINPEFDKKLRKWVANNVKAYMIANRKRLILDYIVENLPTLLAEDRLLTAEEVRNMLQISPATLGRRVKSGVLVPVNPKERRNYRFLKSEVINSIKKGGKDD